MNNIIRPFFIVIIVALLAIISFTSFDFITSILPGWNTTILPLRDMESYIWIWVSITAMVLFILKSKGFTNAKPLNYFLWLTIPFIVLSSIRRLSVNAPSHGQYFLFVLILLPYLLSLVLLAVAHPVLLWQLYKNRNRRS